MKNIPVGSHCHHGICSTQFTRETVLKYSSKRHRNVIKGCISFTCLTSGGTKSAVLPKAILYSFVKGHQYINTEWCQGNKAGLFKNNFYNKQKTQKAKKKEILISKDLETFQFLSRDLGCLMFYFLPGVSF